MASPFFHKALEDIDGSASIPVDGSVGTWSNILSNLYPQYEPPALTLSSAFILVPIAHKYNFVMLLKQLAAFITEISGALSHNPKIGQGAYIISWLALAERLQLDELVELCLDRLRTMTRGQLQVAITKAVEVGSNTSEKLLLSLHDNRRAVRVEVNEFSEALREKLLAITSLWPY
ncbi:hypothetical protein FOA52_001867 [Chlamydomonas sp. UWO 241]|nr:hypothetical protein FOA52_001867 [Chlamydomonas sp. UWO 241]